MTSRRVVAAALALALVACGRFRFDDRGDGRFGGDSPSGGDGTRGPLHATYLKASNTNTFDQFGFAVAMSADGSTLAAGAINESSDGSSQANNATSHSGAVYVFVRAGATWAQQGYLKTTIAPPEVDGNLGAAVALSADGSTLITGAVGEGAAHVFVRTGTTWSEQDELVGSLMTGLDQAGFSVGISADGNTVAFGVPLENVGAASSGGAYVFVRAGSTWSEQAHLKALVVDAMDEFGTSIALSEDGNTLVVGAPTEDGGVGGINGNQNDNTQLQAGAAYVFTRTGTMWSQQAYVKAPTPITGDFFGEAVAASGDTIVVGAPGQDTLSNAGAAFVFTRNGTTWSQQAVLNAPNRDVNDQFGTGVALAGDTIVVGAEFEDSGSTGIDGDPGNNSLADSGAAYTFTRTGTTWTPQHYLKATNPTSGDNYGLTIGLAADGSCIVGSFYEDGSATGIDSLPDDNDMDAGAAYVYSY